MAMPAKGYGIPLHFTCRARIGTTQYMFGAAMRYPLQHRNESLTRFTCQTFGTADGNVLQGILDYSVLHNPTFLCTVLGPGLEHNVKTNVADEKPTTRSKLHSALVKSGWRSPRISHNGHQDGRRGLDQEHLTAVLFDKKRMLHVTFTVLGPLSTYNENWSNFLRSTKRRGAGQP